MMDRWYDQKEESILIAEDSPVQQLFFQRQLNKLGYFNLTVVVNGYEALQKAKINRFSIIFMDCEMPILDGFDATKEIRAYEAGLGRYTPIIAISGHDLEQSRKCIELGMDDCLIKPIRTEDLQAILVKHLA
ncbi:response regulator [Heliorestis convoluta]|uniref:Stage 0 sporulation protein A homolog n=1 Tax=Heliorestis convoluta TaxID=356322 RepID=A0A5Q2MZQ6_9FIRM|nr:response regulator [Heliorestis convoluta]QGG46933.1 response regulator [Heliorestis convoluta]